MNFWQWAAIVYLVLSVIGGFWMHGEKHTYDATYTVMDAIVCLLILYGGGFFK